MFPNIAKAEGKAVIEGIPIPLLQTSVETLLRENGQSKSPAKTVQFELPPGRFLVAHLTRPLHSLDSLGIIIVIYDATEIMRLEAMRRDFVSNVSHELRTPLTAIRGYAKILMLADDLPEDRRAFASVIHNHAAALSKLISDLLVLARIENDRENIELAPVDLETAYKDAASHCREQAADKNLRFEADLDHTPVTANASLLAQVFRNLLENACRYAPEGGAVYVTAQKEGKTMLCAVADDGPGIQKEALPRIFECFYQVKEERNSGTSGIGLAICKHIIERHGGRIWAESPHESHATAILFTVPLTEGIS
jgi:two-component system phosphate regulon sensor histidine kinase PhoR